jgi:hypothetical protein
MKLEQAQALKVGDKVKCPKDRGDKGYDGVVTFVGETVQTHPSVPEPFIWVTVQKAATRHTWSSNRIEVLS